jgi:hypothetical protein
MASAIVAAPADLSWLAERYIVIGARVGSCVKAHAPFGTVMAIRSTADITVAWDDATVTTETWSALAPLGYTVEIEPLAASASQWAAAAMHLDRRSEWLVYRVDGVRYVRMISGRSGKVYAVRASADGCSCRWYLNTARQCSHALALELAATMDELAATQAAPAAFPPCRVCGSLTDGPRRLCDDCAASQARRLDRAARVAVAA